MSTAELIRVLCKEECISLAELARRMGQTPQNFNKKLKRNTISTEELILIADVLEIKFEQTYLLSNGKKLAISSDTIKRHKEDML